ncbi:hypothetical protein [Martelella endophytica]|uniref:Uncharacterized protein n=1 Tax=Martelella endophytica TaxID=1486262 RepID=A0A0D5LMZ7_MAREN|nr:hypothetical protein [Martelella endophytica]AJY44683.1 hypothetical protein TM49_01680 [Martelella endophytica]
MSLASWLISHGPDTTVDLLARWSIESGRDWRSAERLQVARPVRRARIFHEGKAAAKPTCRLVDACGYNYCEACGGNDFQDVPFTCGVAV